MRSLAEEPTAMLRESNYIAADERVPVAFGARMCPREAAYEGPDGESLGDGLAAGRQEAFDYVFRTHARSVLGYLQVGVGYRTASGLNVVRVTDPFDAEDLCHESFSAFFAQCEAGNFDTSRPVKPYLLGIAARLALHHLRRTAREIPTEALELEPYEDDTVGRREEGRLLAEFRDGLDDFEQNIFIACFLEHENQRETGRRLGVSRDKVYRTLCSIRSKATRFFARKGWFDET